jgi:hypothetical protein
MKTTLPVRTIVTVQEVDSDTYLAEIRTAATRSHRRRVVEITLAWAGMFAACGVIWYGVLKAIGAIR